jgi:hypothetical protein
LSQAVRLNTNQMAIILGAVLIGAFGVIFLIRGIIQNNKENLNIGESKLA